MYTLNCNGNPLLIDRPLIMGILNYTGDSFYAGSRLKSDYEVIQKAIQFADQGADILDIGAQSTRPGSERLSSEEEIQKLRGIIPLLKKQTGKLISVDTYHAGVAQFAVASGADIINDISGGTMDEKMIETVGRLKVPYICMHIKGTPEDMQQRTDYGDILKELLNFFIERIAKCKEAGIHDVIIDPGIGFAKTISQNFYLIKNLSVFRILERPILIGASRKSFIYRSLGVEASEALNGTTVMNTLALQNGVEILRVHDVKEAAETVKLMKCYQEA